VDPLLAVSVGLVLAVLALVITIRTYADQVGRLRDQLREQQGARRDLEAMQARLAAQWGPVLSRYPYDPRNMRHVAGAPFDAVQLEEDRVVLVAFPRGALTPEQERVRDQVRAGRVEWAEVPLFAPQAPPSEL
jgi:predicted Holliday junction resolvase-like endonuclease